MVEVIFDPFFKKNFKKIKDHALKEKIIKQLSKIRETPGIGKPMKYAWKGTRELYIAPFRLSYKIEGEIVFMNNHSTDNTGKLADLAAKKDKANRIRVIHRVNRPSKDLGSSLREGISNARGNFILIMDCDLSHDPAEIKELFDKRNEADVIVGSRFAGGSADMNLKRTILTRTYNMMISTLLNMHVKDITTGFKLYKRGVLQSLNLTNDGFGLHVEILIKAALKGYKIKEVPIHYKKSLKSTLNYRKQFKSYMKPFVLGLKEKYLSFI